MQYLPGSHVIASLSTQELDLLQKSDELKTAVDGWIAQYGLHKLGEVYHDFSPAGYTAVICLSESHISVHTWPEFGRVNLDIYLSNYERNNDGTVQSLYQAFISWFGADILQEQILQR
ncbi:MAG TPA: S-adenosylmethionine decarboxylase [Puia sp.]|nr:S-adenosylmethionine decarboxylase [Puia sp.]